MGFWSSVVGIIGVVAAPFTGGASLLLTAAAVVAPKVVDKVVDFVMKPFLGMMGVPTMDMSAPAEAERQQGVLLQRQGSVNNVPVVYGYRKLGDIVTFAETGSTDNKYLWVAHVFSEGTVAALRNIYIDDNLLPDGITTKLNAGQTVEVDSGKYNGRVKLQFFKGIYATDPTDPGLPVPSSCFFNTDADKPPNWTKQMVYNGLAVVFARYEWKKVTSQAEQDANPFGYSIPSMSVEMFGKILSPVPSTAPANEYDGDSARYEVITTGSGQTIGYVNPVEVLLDYMRNPRYGKGLKNADIDWASWYIAAQKCKTEVTYVNGIKGPIMSMNFVLDTSQTIFNNTKTLLSNFRGYLPYVQGKYKLKIEDAGHPTDILSGSAEVVAQFDKNNIIGEIVWTGIERTNKYNQVVVTWVDPDNKWSNQEVVYPELESDRQVYIAQDGGRENKGVFTASGITNSIMASDMARILFWKSRLSDSVSLTVSSQGLELEPGDCIHVSGNLLTFNTTYPWRVISSTLNNDMTVTLGCVFVPDTIFPYTRWNEPDKVLPVYIPKGAERYYPKITPSEKNGLLPPYPSKPEVPVIGTPVQPLNDVIQITNIKFMSMDNNPVSTSSNVHFELEFNQPNSSLYSGTMVYWKEDVASAKAWLQAEFPLNTAPGVKVFAQAGPVVYGKTYVMNTRVMYQSGQASSATGVYKFTVTGTSVTPGVPVVPPPGSTPIVPPTNTAENFFASVIGTTLLDGTYPNLIPKNPRQISVTLKQDMVAGVNQYLESLEVFWKPSANPKWSYKKTAITVAQGADISTTLLLGPRLYPLRPGYNGEAPATADDYDFIFRFTYNDGKISKYQYHATKVSIEWNGITWGPFNPFALTGTGTVILNKELSADYVPQIAGANDIVDTRYIEISTPYSMRDNGTITGSTPVGIRFFFYPPADADRVNWRGVRVYRHKAGASGTGDYVDFLPATASGNIWSVFLTGITYDETWEYVLVALVTYGDEIVESNRGQYVSGKIHNRGSDADYPFDSNWNPKFRIESLEALATALGRRGTAAASGPRQDTYIASFSSATVLTAGVPTSPRKLSFTFTQSVANGTNGRIAKYAVYYKQADAVYWKRSVYNLTSYTEGTAITFDSTQTTPVMDLGFPSAPNLPGRDQYYDFVVRYVYDDSSESTYEHAWINTSIENRGTSTENIYSFAPLLPVVNNGRRSSTVLTTEDKAPPGAVLDVRNILTSTSMYPIAAEVMDNTVGNVLRFGFAIPIASLKSYLAGFRVLRRDVISGAQTQFTTDDSNIPYKLGEAYINSAYVSILSAWSRDTIWHKEYEWAIIPIVWYQGAKVEANNAVYWRGRVCDSANSLSSNPWVSNWFSKRSPEIQTTTEIRNRLAAPFPETGPYARVQTITRTNPDFALAGGNAFGYWTIQYQVPSNFVSAKIYRRQCHDPENGTPLGYYQRKADFGQAGQWELININNSNNPIVDNGGYKLQTVNLRPAIGDYFNDSSYEFGYNVTYPKNSALGGNFYAGYNTVAPTQSGSSYTKYWLQGDNRTGQQTSITQILIVISTTISNATVQSTHGVIVNLYNFGLVNGVSTRNGPGNIIRDVTTVVLADLEAALSITALDLSDSLTTAGRSVDASWTTLLRKPSEAIALVADASIQKPGQFSASVTYTKPTASPGVQ